MKILLLKFKYRRLVFASLLFFFELRLGNFLSVFGFFGGVLCFNKACFESLFSLFKFCCNFLFHFLISLFVLRFPFEGWFSQLILRDFELVVKICNTSLVRRLFFSELRCDVCDFRLLVFHCLIFFNNLDLMLGYFGLKFNINNLLLCELLILACIFLCKLLVLCLELNQFHCIIFLYLAAL